MSRELHELLVLLIQGSGYACIAGLGAAVAHYTVPLADPWGPILTAYSFGAAMALGHGWSQLW